MVKHEGDRIEPEIFELADASFVLVFDREERLSQFVGRPAPYAAPSGRATASMLAGQGIGLAVNIEVAPSSILLPARGQRSGAGVDISADGKFAFVEFRDEQLATVALTLFDKMDIDKDGSVTKDEATKFFKSFSKVNATAMFNEVDEDGNGSIAYDEWIEFWRNVMGTGTYETEDVMEELESMMEGGAWVDWNDGRTT